SARLAVYVLTRGHLGRGFTGHRLAPRVLARDDGYARQRRRLLAIGVLARRSCGLRGGELLLRPRVEVRGVLVSTNRGRDRNRVFGRDDFRRLRFRDGDRR